MAVLDAWACQSCGAGLDAACDAPSPSSGCRIDHELIVYRLERAGATLLAMRTRSPFPAGYGSTMPEPIREAIEAYGWSDEPNRAALPDAAAVSAMDRTFRWLSLIPDHRRVLRRIVAARSLVSPTTDRHLIGWRRLARLVHADHHAVMRWHGHGIGIIIDCLTNVPK